MHNNRQNMATERSKHDSLYVFWRFCNNSKNG